MRLRPIAPLLSAVLIALPVFSQSPQTPPPLPAGTQLVVVDVVAQDKSGQPLHGLKATDFQVSENGAPQALHSLQEHDASTNGAPDAPMKLADGEFTNITGIKPGETLNVLLLDELNTPSKDQAFMRQQLLQYAQKAPAGAHLAIFGLSTHLTMLQSFTADPALLKDAVGHKLIPRAAALQDDPGAPATEAGGATAEAAALAVTSANLAAFEAQNTSLETSLHGQYTLDALNTLAHYLGGFQGRKNLIWFSSSFPVDLLPSANTDDALRQTATRLSLAQVAVYPVDARGLMAGQAHGEAGNEADQHPAMTALADDTGGRAIFNPASLADAVHQAVSAGADYYTLAYASLNAKQDGGLRTLHVALAGKGDAKLTYRKGFFAPKPVPPLAPPPAAPKETASAAGKPAEPVKESPPVLTPEQEAAKHSAAAYANAAMARGGPPPQDIPFKVRVLPASKTTEDAIAPGNEFGSYKLPGPYQRFALDFVALPTSFAYHREADDSRNGALEFIAYVYTADGRLINTVDRTIGVRIPADKVAEAAKQAVQFHLDISSPAKTETYLRIAIRDMLTNRFGVVELPASAVSTLEPPVYPAGTPPAAPDATKPAVTPGAAPAAPQH